MSVSSVLVLLRVVVVQPRAEREQAAQLAPVLVREDVVGIVRARAVVAERADRLSLERLAGERAIAAVGPTRRPLQQQLEIVGLHLTLAAVVILDARAVADLQRLAANASPCSSPERCSRTRRGTSS